MPEDPVSNYWNGVQVNAPLKERIAQEREQHYHFTLNDFEELVRQYGAPKILADLSEETYWAIMQHAPGE